MGKTSIIGVISLLAVSASWSLETDARSEHFHLGSNAILKCSNKTWSEMIYTIWKLNLDGIMCQISSSNDNLNLNTCNDGKAMLNTSRGESYLQIPGFSKRDEGIYHCESVYKAGSYTSNIDVSLIAPPSVSAWLEWEGSRQVAVCLAEGGKPAASISWSEKWNSTSTTTLNLDGFNKVESRLVLPEGIATGNLTCAVIHPSWEEVHMVTPEIFIPWRLVIISVGTISFIMAILGGLYFTRKHPCRISPKAPQSQDYVEEVEPYASYVQSVNSIYNSSADLFT
ncbi:cell surface glycoprotein CD200 receptor 1-A isoform X3 [Salmo salar]|uniref:Cell surface glycoprotein CD200 receptor 1-A isoform X3 n=1 Tax=Salmo salar TaxID=8030 RepID=A0A1S3NY91_SALSA|nr:cell surface glycoprotein CD200 receptor 1-A isoform X3 [Salmo salar]|eukprot:XP_014020352.1 PREDICTED: cell surface glycoprotein CD200 receptor 1-A-like isoform X2 [Salmo salar]